MVARTTFGGVASTFLSSESRSTVLGTPGCSRPYVSISEHTFEINRERAIDYLNTRDNVYVFDGFAGWDPKYRIKVRVIASRAYHALFMVS